MRRGGTHVPASSPTRSSVTALSSHSSPTSSSRPGPGAAVALSPTAEESRLKAKDPKGRRGSTADCFFMGSSAGPSGPPRAPQRPGERQSDGRRQGRCGFTGALMRLASRRSPCPSDERDGHRRQDAEDRAFGGADRPAAGGEDETDDEEHHQPAAPMTGHQGHPVQADNVAIWAPRVGLGPDDDAANATDRATLLKPWSGGTAHVPGGSTPRRSSHGQARPRLAGAPATEGGAWLRFQGSAGPAPATAAPAPTRPCPAPTGALTPVPTNPPTPQGAGVTLQPGQGGKPRVQ